MPSNSSMVPHRARGTRSLMYRVKWSRCCSGPVISVAIHPGLTALTRMRWGARETARVFISPSWAALLAA